MPPFTCSVEHGLERLARDVVNAPLSTTRFELDPKSLLLASLCEGVCQSDDREERQQKKRAKGDDWDPEHGYFTRLGVSATISASASAVLSEMY